MTRPATLSRRNLLGLGIGSATLAGLWLAPEVSLRLFWNLLIPAVPALLVFAPGMWRNVCPLGAIAGLGRLRRGPARRLGLRAQGAMALGSVALLFVLLPLRPIVFNQSPLATALVLGGVAVTALLLTTTFQSKSGWCAGLCPVNAVEKLYGQSPAATPPNAQCRSCDLCVAVCPDSVRRPAPLRSTPTALHRVADAVMAGGFVGFVGGWFQVPDGTRDLGLAYGAPLLGAASTLGIFLVLLSAAPDRRGSLVRAFGVAAVVLYYWFRIPAMIGLGIFPGDGLLVDLSQLLPPWSVWILRGVTTAALLSRFTRRRTSSSWQTRPPIVTAN